VRALIVSHLYQDLESRGKLRALAGHGVDLMVAVPGGSLSLDGGIRFTPVPVKGDRADPGALAWNARALRRIVSDFRPDLVHIEETPGTQAAAAAAGAARRIGIPHVVASTESLRRRRGLFEGRRYRGTLADAAGVTGINRLATDLLAEAAPRAKRAVLPWFGVSPAAPVPRAEPRELQLGFIGRLVPEKGAEDLLRTVASLLGAWRLTMVGTGPEQESLEALAQRLGLASRIRWMGGLPRTELSRMWPEIDCLVVPSRDTPDWVEKGSPVLLEGMARGIPAVVTRAGALPDLVGDSGLIADDQEGLLLALQTLLAEPQQIRRLGERARQRVLEEFVDAAVAKRTAAFWQEVVAGAAQPARGA
jgi:glycosyltransferase involved in cell wall biosynthesis